MMEPRRCTIPPPSLYQAAWYVSKSPYVHPFNRSRRCHVTGANDDRCSAAPRPNAMPPPISDIVSASVASTSGADGRNRRMRTSFSWGSFVHAGGSSKGVQTDGCTGRVRARGGDVVCLRGLQRIGGTGTPTIPRTRRGAPDLANSEYACRSDGGHQTCPSRLCAPGRTRTSGPLLRRHL